MKTENGIFRKLVYGIAQGLVGSLGGRVIGFFASVLAARILGPVLFGFYGIGWTLLRFLSLIFPMGMDRAILRFGSIFWKKDNPSLKALIIQCNFIAFGSGLVFGLALFLIAPWLAATVYQKPELTQIFRLFAIAFPMLSLLVTTAATTRVTQSVKTSVMIQDLGQPLLGLALMIVFYFLGLGLSGVIISDVTSISLAVLACTLMIFRIFPEITEVSAKGSIRLKELLTYSIPAAAGGAFSVYIFWIDRILIGYFRSTFENGIYLAVSQISTIFLVIQSGISVIVVPMFSHFFNLGDWANLEEVYRISTKWGIYISIPFLIILICAPSSVISLIYGNSYSSGGVILLLLLIGQVVNLITGSVNPLLVMTGNQKFLSLFSLAVFTVDLIFLIGFVPKFGMAGAAFITSVSLSILYIGAVLWVKKKLGLWPYDKRFFKGGLAGFVSLFIVILLYETISLTPALKILLGLATSFITFLGILFIQKIDPEDREFFRMILRRVETGKSK